MKIRMTVKVPDGGGGTDRVPAVLHINELPPNLKKARTMPIARRA